MNPEPTQIELLFRPFRETTSMCVDGYQHAGRPERWFRNGLSGK